MSDNSAKDFQNPVARIIWNYKNQAEEARRDRVDLNKENFEIFHLRQDYSHKAKGQSKEFLAKQMVATEQMSAFLSQGLYDPNGWNDVENAKGYVPQEEEIQAEEIKKIINHFLDSDDMKYKVILDDSLKLGLLGSLMIRKIHGCYKQVLESVVVEKDENGKEVPVKKFKKRWFPKISLVRQQDFFPDSTGDGRFIIERVEMDYCDLLKLSKDNPGVFDDEAIKSTMNYEEQDQKHEKSRETGQNTTFLGNRKRVVIYEFWGDIIDETTGEILHENSQCIINEQGLLIMPPRENPFWHQKKPYVVTPIIRVPKSVWHRAWADAPTKHNKAINELYNLMFDGGMSSVHGVKQIREDWLSDPSEIDDGIPPGSTLRVNAMAPTGAKVMERVDTSNVNSTEAQNMFGATEREFNQSAFTNDLRMGGLPERSVKATEIVTQNQSINQVLNSIVGSIETGEVDVLRLLWETIAQHIDNLDSKEMQALLGKERAAIHSAKSKAQIYKETILGKKFKVYGLSNTVKRLEDFRKFTTLLQVIGSNPLMMSEFQRKYSMTKLLGEIVKSVGVESSNIEADETEMQDAATLRQGLIAQATNGMAGLRGQEAPSAANAEITGIESNQPQEAARGSGEAGGSPV